jgi:hypothetical protein
MTTGIASFEGSSVRKTLPEALLSSEIPSATWLVVGCLFPVAIMMLCGRSKVVLSTLAAVCAARAFTTLVRSAAIFGGRLESELTTGDRSSVTTRLSRCLTECEDGAVAGILAVAIAPPFPTLYR